MSGIIGEEGSNLGIIGGIEVRFFADGNDVDGGVDVANTNGVGFARVLENVGGGMHASNGVFTAPVAGIYHFQAQIYNYTSGTNNYQWQMTANAQSKVIARFHGTTIQGRIVRLVAMKYIRKGEAINITNNQGSTRAFYSGSTAHSHFQGSLIRVGGVYV